MSVRDQIKTMLREGFSLDDAIGAMQLDPMAASRMKESFSTEEREETVEDRLEVLQHQTIDVLTSIITSSPNDNARVAAVRELNAMRQERSSANNTALKLALERANAVIGNVVQFPVEKMVVMSGGN